MRSTSPPSTASADRERVPRSRARRAAAASSTTCPARSADTEHRHERTHVLSGDLRDVAGVPLVAACDRERPGSRLHHPLLPGTVRSPRSPFEIVADRPVVTRAHDQTPFSGYLRKSAIARPSSRWHSYAVIHSCALRRTLTTEY